MVISMILISILLIIVSPAIYQGAKGTFLIEDLTSLNWSPRESMDRLGREIYSIRSLNMTTAHATTLTFVNNVGTSVTFSYDGGTQQILRDTDVVASHASSFTFGYYDATGVPTAVIADIRFVTATAIFTLNGTSSPMYTTTIFMRTNT